MDVAVSVIIPVLDEAASVAQLVEELDRAFPAGQAVEYIFIDDGSRDGTSAEVMRLAAGNPRVGLVVLTRNFGKSAAYMAGFEAASGRLIVTMDGDLQDDPAEVGKLLAALDEELDLVVGWKQGRLGNEPAKKVASSLYHVLKHRLFGTTLHDSNSGFRAMRAEVARALSLHGDHYRLIPELATLRGFRVGEVPVAHRRRVHGRSKYGARRFWTGLLDLVTVRFLSGYSARPLHFFGTVALAPLIIGVGLELYVLAARLGGSTFRTHLAAIIIGALLIMVGFQLLAIGLIGEMIGAQDRRPRHAVRMKHLPGRRP